MNTIELLLLCLLVAWWGVLTIHQTSLHRDRVKLAAEWTPRDEKSYRRSMASDHRILAEGARITGLKRYVLISPFIFLFLPYFLYHRFVKDPFAEKHNDAT